mmetsp:Transcript_19979/g.26975  ORF Transcript_19979/g.26975 Transcript_19979/m.26975 type:complete len:145 (+) Transcript_19979:2049-2483(+)
MSLFVLRTFIGKDAFFSLGSLKPGLQVSCLVRLSELLTLQPSQDFLLLEVLLLQLLEVSHLESHVLGVQVHRVDLSIVCADLSTNTALALTLSPIELLLCDEKLAFQLNDTVGFVVDCFEQLVELQLAVLNNWFNLPSWLVGAR